MMQATPVCEGSPEANLPEVDVIIRNPGHTDRLDVCLRSLEKQSGVIVHPIIVVTRANATYPPHVKDMATFVHDTAEPFNYSRALNTGFARGTSALILSFSSHCELIEPSTLQQLAACFQDGNVIAASCETPHAESDDWVKQSKSPSRFTTTADTFNGFNGLSNPCGMIRRKDWEERPFQEDIPCAEDQEWAGWALRRKAGKAVFFRGFAVSHNQSYCLEKLWRDRVIIGSRVHKPLGSWRGILREAKQALGALGKGNLQKAVLHLGYAACVAAHRLTGWTPTNSAYGSWRRAAKQPVPAVSN